MIAPRDIPFELLALLLYAETHYRFRFFFSSLKKNEPEIIADAPFRVQPGHAIPLLLLAKDGDRFPGLLKTATVIVSQGGREVKRLELLRTPQRLIKKWWWKIADIPVEELRGWVDLDVVFDVEVAGRTRTYRNDNYRTSSHSPLRVFVASDPLPTLPGMVLGDLHTHSDRTDDQVEFGIPPAAPIRLSRSLGLSFFAVTDHSYDLDDRVDSYLRNDSGIPKWHALQRDIDVLLRRHRDFAILRGEEVSCRSVSGHNVHLLRLGSRVFIPGSGDGAERWFRTRSEHSAHDVLAAVDSAVSFAAHPVEDVPLLQRVLLHRGPWLDRDIRLPGLTGVQFANGSRRGFLRGVRQWTRALLEGHRLLAVAGSDAHGNFNRFRQIGIPFLKIRESGEHLFGRMRTGVFVSRISEIGLLKALKAGNCIITDGPVAGIQAWTTGRGRVPMGSRTRERDLRILVRALSTPEFGSIDRVVLWTGTIGEADERPLYEVRGNNHELSFDLSCHFHRPSYVRLEVWTSSAGTFDGQGHWCLTNPLWAG
ncbi:MAG: hypothetical protein HBSIN02_21940 [Bacteroidia bacterium]|nr:MAG: hypothetical protein HBSIN02_21940 [Bacteroidia bacterium]